MAFVDLTGMKFGFWTVIRRFENLDKNCREAKWLCKCKCGNEKIVKTPNLKRGKSKSCGCWDSNENGFVRAFEKKTKLMANGCLEWTGRRDRDGYARFGEKSRLVSRMLYEKHHGKIEDGMFICHTCDNPGCVKLEHLWIGTPKENSHDAVKKGRTSSGTSHHKHKLKEEEIKEIRFLYEQGMNQTKLAEKFNVSQPTISTIILRKFWRKVK